MRNADMPAMPIVNADGYAANPASGAIDPGCCSGLSKREYFAGLVMQGIASDSEFEGSQYDAAQVSVWWADALLAELEKESQS